MDEYEGDGTFSERFRAFRKAVHLESPLEFAVVLIVVVCLVGGVGVWLRTPGNWFLLKHGMWGQLLGGSPRRGNNGAGAGADQAGSNAASNPAQGGAGTGGTASASVAPAQGTIKITRQKSISSTNSDLPNGLEIALAPDREMTPVAMMLKFSGEVGEIHSSLDSETVLDSQTGIEISSPDTVIMEWRTPPFGPFSPLLMTVFSKDPIKLVKAVTISYRYPYEGVDLK